jgi:hypothetical protein
MVTQPGTAMGAFGLSAGVEKTLGSLIVHAFL